MGEKLFCKTRMAIVNQQRVFAVQVFELQWLIKVQRLIAGSPHLLFDDDDFLTKPPAKVPPLKKVRLEHALEPLPLNVKPKEHPQNPNSRTEFVEESEVGKLPLPYGLSNRPSDYGATNVKPALWCLQPPPGNMWLVPAKSPPYGLAYKPYTWTCPPTGGYMAPMYGSCSPASVNPGTRDYLNAAYGVQSSYQQGMTIGTPRLLPTYIQQYGMPIINPSLSSSVVDNMIPFSGGHSNALENPLSLWEINFNGQVTPCQSLKGSDLQGSTTVSFSDRTTGNVLPLFPITPQIQEPAQKAQSSEHQTHAIKVIPRNTKSASESAARIFLSIQEERK